MFSFAAIPWIGVPICMIVAIVSGSIWFGPKTFSRFGGKGLAKRIPQSPAVVKIWEWFLG